MQCLLCNDIHLVTNEIWANKFENIVHAYFTK